MCILICLFTVLIIFILSVFAYRWLRIPKPKPHLVRPFLENSKEKPAILAHRGGCCEAPENTLAAFKMAKENGAEGVEFDVDFTRDGKAVVVHDRTVDRTTNGSGHVQEFSLEDIQKLDASAKHPLRNTFPDEKIPSLEDTVTVCSNLGLKMYIEIKSGSHPEKTAAFLKNLFSTYQLHNKALVCCYFPNVIYKLRLADPNIMTAIVWWHGSLSYIVTGGKNLYEIDSPFKVAILEFLDKLWDAILPRYMDFVGVPILSCGKELVCQHMIEKWKDRGVKIVAWTVNHLAAKDYFMDCLGCPVITDCVRRDTVDFSAT